MWQTFNASAQKRRTSEFDYYLKHQLSLIAVLIVGTFWVISGSAHWVLLATVLILIARISDVLNFFVQMSSLLEIFVISCEKFEN